jgi:hypothetical protein
MRISAAKAKLQGLKHYFTGVPCKFGHVAKRQVSNRGCVVCLKSKATAWAKANPERTEEIRSSWNSLNREKTNARMRQRRIDYPDSYKQAIANWRKNNATRYAVYAAHVASMRRAKKLNQTPKWLTENDITAIECKYSVCAMLNKYGVEKWEVDHIVPLQGANVSGLHTPSNLRVIPKALNRAKGNKLLEVDSWH